MEEGNENGGEDGEEDGENDEEGEEDSEDTDEGYDDDDREGDDGAGDDGDENDENSARKRAGRGRGKVSAGEDSKKAGGRSGKPKTDAIAAGTMTQSVDEMVHSSILYLLLQHHKKLPIKRADIVKNAMNGQLRSFPEVIESVKKIFEEVDRPIGYSILTKRQKFPNFNLQIFTEIRNTADWSGRIKRSNFRLL